MDSMSLVTAQISFNSTHLSLVHIPNEFFHFFCSDILQILFSSEEEKDDDNDKDYGKGGRDWTDRHEFLNLSITGVGCSVIASSYLIDKYLRPRIIQFRDLACTGSKHGQGPDISLDEFIAVQVDGQGLDAAQRVLELTAPLAMAGISIFFITTYFSDYILVPVRAKQNVLVTLQQRGFVFSRDAEAYVSQLSPILSRDQDVNKDPLRPRTTSSGECEQQRPSSASWPSTPPARDVPELQTRTFAKLAKYGIRPLADPSLRLVACAGGRETDTQTLDELKQALIQVLIESPVQNKQDYQNNGRSRPVNSTRSRYAASFLSVTLSTEPISILMEERLLPVLGDTLFGSKGEEDVQIPITFDLRDLDWRATGIVGGVAGRMSQGSQMLEAQDDVTWEEPLEISFLSSAKAGTVIVQARLLERALKALEQNEFVVREVTQAVAA